MQTDKGVLMSTGNDFAPAINRMAEDIAKRESKVSEMKRTVNTLCEYAGLPPMYLNIEDPLSGATTSRRDQFFGVPLATAVRDYLGMRGDPKAGGRGAATVNEIYAALKDGGFAFDAKNDENAKRGLRISLAKNVAAFTKVPGDGEGAFGLADWYPAAKAQKMPNGQKDAGSDPDEDQSPSVASSDVSTTFHSDDASEPNAKGGSDGLASHPDITG
jgi:hypothetical protein